ncbi:MAG: lamin tail domain-containing protein [Candidatus Paceibacterota bacterium]
MTIKEFLPNPVGKDTEGEWIKLFNNGDEEVNLTNWYLKDASGKIFYFGDFSIKPGEYLTLSYQTTKIYLNNKGETLFLFDKNNNLIDQLGFSGIISEGEIITKNKISEKPEINSAQTPAAASQIINLKSKPAFNLNFLVIGFVICLVLSFLTIIIIKKVKINRQDNV